MHYCNRCDYKSNRSWDVKRHFSKMHQNPPTSHNNVAERSHPLLLQQPSQIPLQHPSLNINVQPGAGQRDVSYSDDDDTLSEYSTHGKQHDFFDSDSDSSESDNEPGEAIVDSIDELEDAHDNIIEVRKKFRGSLHEMKDADIDNKRRILKKIAALKVEIIYYGMQQSILKEPRLLKQLRLLKKGKYKN